LWLLLTAAARHKLALRWGSCGFASGCFAKCFSEHRQDSFDFPVGLDVVVNDEQSIKLGQRAVAAEFRPRARFNGVEKHFL